MGSRRGGRVATAALKGFLCFWLPMIATLLAGLWRAWRTGQADPWDWSLPVALLVLLAGLSLARRSWPVLAWGGIGAAVPPLIFCAIAADRLPLAWAAIGLVLVALLAAFAGAWLRRPPFRPARLVAVLMMAAATLLLWRGPAQPLASVADRPKLAVLTGLPLFWAEPGQAGTGPRDAPIVTVLRTRFTVEPLDDPLDLPRTGADRLLLAQPRPMTPAQRVAIDAWVRRGGAALVLADPLLRWPSDLPLGDRRRAPSATWLAPLLAHWGFPPGQFEPAEVRHFTADGQLLTLSAARMADGAAMQRRRVGAGDVLLVGDADLIDDRLWLAAPGDPLDPRAWSADTPACVARWLGAATPQDRHWMRAPADVIAGLRWAILVGTGWAMLGGALLRRQFQRREAGTKSENLMGEPQKIRSTHF